MIHCESFTNQFLVDWFNASRLTMLCQMCGKEVDFTIDLCCLVCGAYQKTKDDSR